MCKLLKVVSGGQTGADKTALVCARAMDIPTGGWVPKGCRTESGMDLSLIEVYGCKETPTNDWAPRTKLNTRDSDITVWFGNVTSPGFRCTEAGCKANVKPFAQNPTPAQFAQICFDNEVVNVAGNREKSNPKVVSLVEEAFLELARWRIRYGCK